MTTDKNAFAAIHALVQRAKKHAESGASDTPWVMLRAGSETPEFWVDVLFAAAAACADTGCFTKILVDESVLSIEDFAAQTALPAHAGENPVILKMNEAGSFTGTSSQLTMIWTSEAEKCIVYVDAKGVQVTEIPESVDLAHRVFNGMFEQCSYAHPELTRAMSEAA